MKIGTRVYVSFLSGSKIAGEVGTIVGHSTRDGYKVRTDFGVIGYPKPQHVSEIFEDAPALGIDGYTAKTGGYVGDTDVAHMYLTQIRLLEIKDPTDLICRAVRFETPFTPRTLGWVSDQWIEDGVELLNVVHNGSFTVVPRSFVTDVFTVLGKNKSLVRVI